MALKVIGVVGRPDIAPLITQAAREVRKDTGIAGFRKGKAPLKLVIAREAERVRKRALSWLLDAMQEQVLAKVSEERALLGPPEVAYDKEVKLEQVEEFSVTFTCTLDPAKDKHLAPEEVAKDPRAALSPKPRPTSASGIPLPPGIPAGPQPPTPSVSSDALAKPRIPEPKIPDAPGVAETPEKKD